MRKESYLKFCFHLPILVSKTLLQKCASVAIVMCLKRDQEVKKVQTVNRITMNIKAKYTEQMFTERIVFSLVLRSMKGLFL